MATCGATKCREDVNFEFHCLLVVRDLSLQNMDTSLLYIDPAWDNLFETRFIMKKKLDFFRHSFNKHLNTKESYHSETMGSRFRHSIAYGCSSSSPPLQWVPLIALFLCTKLTCVPIVHCHILPCRPPSHAPMPQARGWGRWWRCGCRVWGGSTGRVEKETVGSGAE